jgi:hypothetical protein
MALQPHQDRVVQERAELKEKLERLSLFIETPFFQKAMDEREKARMLRQQEVMKEYVAVLDDRIAAWGN